MNHDKVTVPDWQLERFLLQELPAAEMESVRSALEHDHALRDRVAALKRSDALLLEEHPPAIVGRAIRAKASAAPASARPLRLSWLPAIAAAVVATALGSSLLRPTPPAEEGIRLKGQQAGLVVYRRGAANPEALASGDVARPGDVVQLAYVAAGRRFGAIVSVDGRGVVTRHLPADGDQASVLRTGGPVLLQRAYELDDAPQLERFYFVTADEPFAVPDVVAAASRPDLDRESGALTLPPSFSQSSFLLRKESSR